MILRSSRHIEPSATTQSTTNAPDHQAQSSQASNHPPLQRSMSIVSCASHPAYELAPNQWIPPTLKYLLHHQISSEQQSTLYQLQHAIRQKFPKLVQYKPIDATPGNRATMDWVHASVSLPLDHIHSTQGRTTLNYEKFVSILRAIHEGIGLPPIDISQQRLIQNGFHRHAASCFLGFTQIWAKTIPDQHLDPFKPYDVFQSTTHSSKISNPFNSSSSTSEPYIPPFRRQKKTS